MCHSTDRTDKLPTLKLSVCLLVLAFVCYYCVLTTNLVATSVVSITLVVVSTVLWFTQITKQRGIAISALLIHVLILGAQALNLPARHQRQHDFYNTQQRLLNPRDAGQDTESEDEDRREEQ